MPEETDLSDWTSFQPTTSDGNRDETDRGTRIAYIDAVAGDNASGAYYWWNGSEVVDASGNTYGDDPLQPSGDIRPFASWGGGGAEVRGGETYLDPQFPDWILLRRGQDHQVPGLRSFGRSPDEPGLVGAYGPLSDPRPRILGSFQLCYCGNPQAPNIVLLSLQMVPSGGAALSVFAVPPDPPVFDGDPEDLRAWIWIEDMLLNGGGYGVSVTGSSYADLTIYRSIFAHVFDPDEHNQGVFINGENVRLRVEETILYRNGFKSDPMVEGANRDVFSRNMYLGGGERLGVRIRNVISADGGSGGPQVRYGGIVEDSLIVEGYWFTATDSNGRAPSWLVDGLRNYEFRDNVQLVYRVPAPGGSVNPEGVASHPGDGFLMIGAPIGVFENNIISGALLDEMGFGDDFASAGLRLEATSIPVQSETVYPGTNVIQNNIFYRIGGLVLRGESAAWENAEAYQFVDNDWFDRGAVQALINGVGDVFGNLQIEGNRFYSDSSDIFGPQGLDGRSDGITASANTLPSRGEAPWPAPNRSLRTYSTDVLGLEVTSSTGMPEFFAFALQMRKGYWDERYTAAAVNDYVRAGFGIGN